MNELSQPLAQVSVWKPGAMRDCMVEIMRQAVRLCKAGTYYFGADDMKRRDFGPHIPGLAIKQLSLAGLTKPTGQRRKSSQPSARGRKLDLYTLTSLSLAEAWLERNGVDESRQLQLIA